MGEREDPLAGGTVSAEEPGTEMQIRVGLHIGPGIGGAIGLKKFIHDVWATR